MYHYPKNFFHCFRTTFSKIMPPKGRKTAKKACANKMSEENSEPVGGKARKSSRATTRVTAELPDQGTGQVKRRRTQKEEDCDKESSAVAGLDKNGTTAGKSKVPKGIDSGISKLSAGRLSSDWFDRPCVTLAQCLLGMKLVRINEMGERMSGVIVETEAYPGGEDKGSCTYNGRQTERMKALYMAPGTVYAYMTYGMYTCINISSQGPGAAVLIRGLEPSEGEDLMRKARSVKKSDKNKELTCDMLCNGPAKLTQALGITKANADQVDLTTSPSIWVEKGKQFDKNDVVACKRIGINKAGEWTDKPLRFYVRGCASVSIRDKVAEGKELY